MFRNRGKTPVQQIDTWSSNLPLRKIFDMNQNFGPNPEESLLKNIALPTSTISMAVFWFSWMRRHVRSRCKTASTAEVVRYILCRNLRDIQPSLPEYHFAPPALAQKGTDLWHSKKPFPGVKELLEMVHIFGHSVHLYLSTSLHLGWIQRISISSPQW